MDTKPLAHASPLCICASISLTYGICPIGYERVNDGVIVCHLPNTQRGS